MIVDTSGRPGTPNQQEEILFHHMALHAGGIPDVQEDLCTVIPPFYTNTCQGVLEPRYEDEFISTAYPKGDNGNVWLYELVYYPTTTNSFGYKLPSPCLLWGTDITDLGTNKEMYRYDFVMKNHHAPWSRYPHQHSHIVAMPFTPRRIDDEFIPDMNQRLTVYRRMAAVRSSEELERLVHEMRDRYGSRLSEEQLTMLVNALLAGSQGRRTDESAPVRVHFNTLGKKNPDIFSTKCGSCHRMLSDRLGAVACGRNLKTSLREMIRNQGNDVRLVVNDEHPFAIHVGGLHRVKFTAFRCNSQRRQCHNIVTVRLSL